MQMMQYILKRGASFLNRVDLPVDEFSDRVRSVQAEMTKQNLGAVLIFGNNDDYAASCYVTGMPAGTNVLIPGAHGLQREVDPIILGGGTGRELPSQRQLTWIHDMRVAGLNPLSKLIRGTIDEMKLGDQPIGTVGFPSALSTAQYTDLSKALDGLKLQAFDSTIRGIIERKRPREILIMREAVKIAQDAAAAGLAAWEAGASNAEAYIAAERNARVNKARCFHGHGNLYGDDLRPYERNSQSRQPQFLLHLAVEYQGYWADATANSHRSKDDTAGKAVEAMVRAAKAGAAAKDVAAAAMAASPNGFDGSYGAGNGIGMSLGDAPFITPTNDAKLVDGSTLTLRALVRTGGNTSLSNAVIQVTPEGGKRLAPRS